MKNTIQSDIDQLKSIIESRTKFLSLSGLSGILAGSYALVGAIMAFRIIYLSEEQVNYNLMSMEFSRPVIMLLMIAAVVFLMAITTAFVLSKRKARREGHEFWTKAAKRLSISFLVPLLAGGVFILILFSRQEIDLIAPCSLIFYGLALINAAHYTFSDVRYLGLALVVLGLVSMLFPGYGLYFWALGFGVFHIFYGLVIYFKHDR